ncbi:peroxisomal sarcosine oxidase isoform X2 [Electrophorus electricus]|uniref:peroxisomal sarcosine oxidase isoform X2 n=1 Tax=Electrophorus electricus TaxID=8005 RepID=UPI000F0A1DBC|nr:peroxisomal sarcosine oxidase isoform X2 [Electrophorus electricus]
MSSEVYDCIVIGAGIQGSCTAYHLAKNNKTTLLLEQFVLPHSRGSSHGQTRIIRKAYEQDFYTHMMEESYELWAQLEKEAGIRLFSRTGLLVMGPEDGKNFQLIKSSLQRNKVPSVELQRHRFSQHIPNVNLAAGDGALVDSTAGVLYADRAVRAAQVVKINVCYWKEKVPGSYSIRNRFPCFIQLEPKEAEHDIYGLPSNEYPGLMKVCYHMGSETDPDERDGRMDRADVDAVGCYIRRCFPGLVPVPAVVESCLYTITPDRHFVLDRHPAYSNIVIGAGFSGHGFKFSPVVGKVLCELSMGQVPSYDLSPFSIRRFQGHRRSAL